MSNYSFRRTTFRNYIWINSGALFQDPTLLDVETSNSGAFNLEIYDSRSVLVRTYRKRNTRGSWTSFYLDRTAAVDDYGNAIAPLPSGKYKFRLVNASSGTRQIRQGSLDYG